MRRYWCPGRSVSKSNCFYFFFLLLLLLLLLLVCLDSGLLPNPDDDTHLNLPHKHSDICMRAVFNSDPSLCSALTCLCKSCIWLAQASVHSFSYLKKHIISGSDPFSPRLCPAFTGTVWVRESVEKKETLMCILHHFVLLQFYSA